MLGAQFLINIQFPIIIFIVTLIGDINDFYLPDIGHELNPLTAIGEVMGIFDFLTGNIIALSMIFISFFIPLKFILKQGIKFREWFKEQKKRGFHSSLYN